MPEFLQSLRHFDLHLWLGNFANAHGLWVYAILFLIVFSETGFVVTPFLPGDSLLFIVGTLAATGVLKIHLAAPLLLLAAISGNTCNYHIGKWIGPRVFRKDGQAGLLGKMLSRKHLRRANVFFDRHGGKAVILGQFVPFVRTFCPFIAGAGAMTYSKFIFFNVVGALLWISVCCGAGMLFGQMKFVKENFEYAMLCVVGVSLLPVLIEFLRSRRSQAAPSGSRPASSQGSQP